jgi:hypothetical protein
MMAAPPTHDKGKLSRRHEGAVTRFCRNATGHGENAGDHEESQFELNILFAVSSTDRSEELSGGHWKPGRFQHRPKSEFDAAFVVGSGTHGF